MKKQNQPRYVPLILAICLIVSPASKLDAQKAFKMGGFSTSVEGTIYLAKDYKPATFSRLLIFTGVHDVEINRLVIEEFGKIGIAAFNGVGHFPPVRDYRPEEYDTFFDEMQIDGLIHAVIKDKWTTGDDTFKCEVELSLEDLRTHTTVATVFAYVRSSYDDPDKGVATFFRAFVREFNMILKGETESEE